MQKIHLKAPDNWINDPNGFIYYKGQYHLFYQYFPYEPRWGTMHWGHAVSKDLVNWEHKGIALFPSKYDDRNGCFSGSAVEHNGRLYLFYTGARYIEENPEDIHVSLNDNFVAAQMLITSEDGEHFDNMHDKRTVIPVLEEGGVGCPKHTRDPKVWRGGNAWYMILGSRREKTHGEVLFYKSDDLLNWDYINRAETQETFSWMWECPDYFRCDGTDVLVMSPIGVLEDGKGDGNQAVCMCVKFDEATCSMQIPDDYSFLDYGMDLYAPQSALDAEGRRTLIAWVRMPEAPTGDWIGMFCIPRVVEVRGGHIYFRPHPNVKSAYTKRIWSVGEADAGNLCARLELKNKERFNIGGYQIWREEKRLCVDRSKVMRSHLSDCRTYLQTPEIKEGNRLEIYVEPNLIEIFVNDGEYVLSNVVYDLSDELTAECESGVELFTLE